MVSLHLDADWLPLNVILLYPLSCRSSACLLFVTHYGQWERNMHGLVYLFETRLQVYLFSDVI